MARMYPPRLHDADVKSNAERKVFAALRDGLDDDWEVFHSTSWVGRDAEAGASDGEIDFVLVHPRRAIVALEVKGGGIECQYGAWYRLPAGGGPREQMRDPFQVALDHRYELSRLLDEQDGFEAAKTCIVHALALPDVTVHQLALAPDAPRELLIDRNEVAAGIAGALDRVLSFHAGRRDGKQSPGDDGAAVVRDVIAPDVRIEVPMAEQFLEEEEALITLTHEQSMLLASLKRNRRLAVYGCAGSGKTMLAVEHAKRLARGGRRRAVRVLQPATARPPARA